MRDWRDNISVSRSSPKASLQDWHRPIFRSLALSPRLPRSSRRERSIAWTALQPSHIASVPKAIRQSTLHYSTLRRRVFY